MPPYDAVRSAYLGGKSRLLRADVGIRPYEQICDPCREAAQSLPLRGGGARSATERCWGSRDFRKTPAKRNCGTGGHKGRPYEKPGSVSANIIILWRFPMRAVVTRVRSASVAIDGQTVGEIGQGFLILLGVTRDDTPALCRKLAEKVLGLRIFRDEHDKMNKGLADVGGSVLVVSQFTLYGDCSHGRRPNFLAAAGPDVAVPLYEQFLSECERLGFPPQHGQFGAYMQVSSVNDGPVTMIVDTRDLK